MHRTHQNIKRKACILVEWKGGENLCKQLSNKTYPSVNLGPMIYLRACTCMCPCAVWQHEPTHKEGERDGAVRLR